MDRRIVKDTLVEYIAKLDEGDWRWVIPRQKRVGEIVGALVDGIIWPVMSGGYWPSDYPTVQRQWVETALVNIEADPSLVQKLDSTDPWGETAHQLDSIAASFPERGWEGQAVEAQQLIRYLNPEAATQIGDLTEKHSFIGSQDFPGARERILGIIRGAATAARRHGQLKTDDAPRNVVNVQQTQTVRQEQQALVLLTVEDVLAWDDLPGELKPSLDEMAAAKDRGDRAGFMRSASEFASRAEAFPSFLAKLGDAWDWISGLL